jgi:tetratricopeptide (TPR) repeat protein
MLFDPNNPIIQRCAQGMNLEAEGQSAAASQLFQQAWKDASTALEKFISAHYVARHQPTVAEKLHWDQMALQLALPIEDERVRGAFPSLYLNVGKGYEDLKDFEKAKENYQLALAFTDYLLADGYGKMIEAGIRAGIQRVTQ